MIVIAPAALLGQVGTRARSEIIQAAVTHTLTSYRLQAYPQSPESPWRIAATNFARLVNRAADYAADAGTDYGFSYSSSEIADALVKRGYMISDINPYTLTPITEPIPEMVIAVPGAPPATIRRETVTLLPAMIPTTVLPTTPAPVVIQPQIPEQKADSGKFWLLGVAALLLAA